MRSFSAVLLFCGLISFKTSAQQTIQCKDLPGYIGRKVTIYLPVVDFDLRQDYIYLYMGNRYPDQEFTVIVKRNNGKKNIKLNKGIILGRAIASLTGYIATYDEEPDTTKNYNDAAIKREFEKGRPMVVTALNLPVTLSITYTPGKNLLT